MSLFKSLTTAGLEETTDRTGGFTPLDTDIYTGIIKLAYAGASQGGAQYVSLVIDIGGKDYNETCYITNKKGENFYLNKNDPSKKVPLPGFTVIDDICLATVGSPLADQDAEDKIIKLYDYEAKKELPKSVPVLTGLLGQTVSLAIVNSLVNKKEKSGNEYLPTAETRNENHIEKVFNTQSMMTIAEARAGKEKGEYHEVWLNKNKNNVQDKRVIKDGVAGVAGAPKQAALGSAAPRKSLFGK